MSDADFGDRPDASILPNEAVVANPYCTAVAEDEQFASNNTVGTDRYRLLIILIVYDLSRELKTRSTLCNTQAAQLALMQDLQKSPDYAIEKHHFTQC